MIVHCFKEKQECCQALAVKLFNVSRYALSRQDCFSIVLSGGSTPKYFYGLLASSPWIDKIEWRKAHIFFGDERCVPPDSVESNYRMAREAMLDYLPIAEHRIHRIHGESDSSVEAIRYQAVIEAYLGRKTEEPFFDLTLLGLGSDGHTASLFPGDSALGSTGLVAPVGVPDVMTPSVKRVSFTLSAIAMSKNICFLVHGADKSRIVEAVLANDSCDYPAAMVQRKNLYWFVSGMDCWEWQDRFEKDFFGS